MGGRRGRGKKELIELLRIQIGVEGDLVRLYEETVREIRSSPIMHLLHTLRLDSRKHIEICQAVIETLEGQPVQMPEKKELTTWLQRHVKLEKESIERANRIVENALIQENTALRNLMEKLKRDEQEHHKALMELLMDT